MNNTPNRYQRDVEQCETNNIGRRNFKQITEQKNIAIERIMNLGVPTRQRYINYKG